MRAGLEPKDIGADRNRLARDGLGLCWRTEYIDEVDWRVDLLQGGVHVLTEYLAVLRVHRDDPLSLRLEIARYDVSAFRSSAEAPTTAIFPVCS